MDNNDIIQAIQDKYRSSMVAIAVLEDISGTTEDIQERRRIWRANSDRAYGVIQLLDTME